MTDKVHVVFGDLSPEFVEAAYANGRVAWDIETTGLDWKSESIATCQLHIPGFGTEIVNISSNPPANLCRILGDAGITKVFHHAVFDLRFMCSKWNVIPSNIQCTKVMAKILHPEKPSTFYSLKALLSSELGVDIFKDLQTSDWMTKNLSAAQIKYAADDVTYLFPLIEQMTIQANAMNLESIVSASFTYLPIRVQTDLAGSGDIYSY